MSIFPRPCPSGPTSRVQAAALERNTAGHPRTTGAVDSGQKQAIRNLGFRGGSVTLVLAPGQLGGGAGRRSNGKCRLRSDYEHRYIYTPNSVSGEGG